MAEAPEFGLAPLRKEGGKIQFDSEQAPRIPREESFWFECRFTKAEFAELAALVGKGETAFAKELAEDFKVRSHLGYGR